MSPQLFSKETGRRRRSSDLEERCAQKDQLIADLKGALDRLTTNNNDMVALLEGKVGEGGKLWSPTYVLYVRVGVCVCVCVWVCVCVCMHVLRSQNVLVLQSNSSHLGYYVSH